MKDRGFKALRERKVVYDEIVKDIDRTPLTLKELRQRLKHIAGLCWGLSIDIATELEERDNLKAENQQQRDEIELLKNRLGLQAMRAESREKLENMTATERLEYKQKLANNRRFMNKKYHEGNKDEK